MFTLSDPVIDVSSALGCYWNLHPRWLNHDRSITTYSSNEKTMRAESLVATGFTLSQSDANAVVLILLMHGARGIVACVPSCGKVFRDIGSARYDPSHLEKVTVYVSDMGKSD